MPTPPRAFQSESGNETVGSEKVVQLSKFRRTDVIEHVQHDGKRTSKPLQIKNHLEFQASIEIDDLPWLHAQFSNTVRNNLVRNVRQVLDNEFGSLRVHRYRRLFVVRHKSIESLIAGLLRAQFHTHQITLPETNIFGDSVDPTGVSITWGVGRNGVEAESERLKRRRQKNYRR